MTPTSESELLWLKVYKSILQKDANPKRETWMTELPPDLSKNFGGLV